MIFRSLSFSSLLVLFHEIFLGGIFTSSERRFTFDKFMKILQPLKVKLLS